MQKWAVYQIRDRKSDKWYVGRTRRLHRRWEIHRSNLKCGTHHNLNLQAAWNASKPTNFLFEEVARGLTDEESQEVEEEMIATGLETGQCFNIGKHSYGGDNLTNHPNKDEVVRRRTVTQKEKLSGMSTDERRLRYGRPGESNPMFGRSHTAETKARISKLNKGKPGRHGQKNSAEQNRLLSEFAKTRTGTKNPFFGKHHTDETKAKIAAKKRGQKGTNGRPVIIQSTVYPSVTEAAKALGVCPGTIIFRIRSKHWPEYKYETDKCLTTIENPERE